MEALFSEARFEPGQEPPIVTKGVFNRDQLWIAGPSTGWSDTPSAFSFPALGGFCLEDSGIAGPIGEESGATEGSWSGTEITIEVATPGTAGPTGEESGTTESSWSGTKTAIEAAAPAELVLAEFSTGGSAGEVNLFQTNH